MSKLIPNPNPNPTGSAPDAGPDPLDVVGALTRKLDELSQQVAQVAQRPAAAPARTGSALENIIAQRLAAAERPTSDVGAPAAARRWSDDEVPLYQMSNEQRNALIKAKGHKWYRDTMRQQMKGVKVKLSSR